jgi:hypothetical protein
MENQNQNQNQNLSENINDQKDALQVLISAIMIGQKRGAWTLQEAEILSRAVKMFIKNNE